MATIDIYQPAIFHKNINVVKACKTSSHINCGHNCGHSGTIWSSSPFDTLFRCVVVIIVVKNFRQYDPLILPQYYETTCEEYKKPFKIILPDFSGIVFYYCQILFVIDFDCFEFALSGADTALEAFALVDFEGFFDYAVGRSCLAGS